MERKSLRPYPASGTLRDGQWIKRVPSKYTPAQVAQYLSAIGYDPLYDEEAISSGRFPTNLDSLGRIMRLHVLTFPFENTSMHYTAEHAMDVTPEGTFARFVSERKGGSYCFGQNGLLLEILRGLGFRAYAAGARVNEAPIGLSYTPAVHLVILAQPSANDNQTYLVDVGFGLSCITCPLLLSADPENINNGLSETERHRLTYNPPAASSLAASPDFATNSGDQWNVEIWHKKPTASEEAWYLQFSFTEAEFWLPDISFGSFGVSTQPGNLFWNNILCLKMFTVDEGYLHLERSKRPIYRMVLFRDQVKKHTGAEVEVLHKLKTELDRIRVLREIFGVQLDNEDQVHMVGRAAAYV
ncbi:cysteine proteinase [Macrolepiota fuliginosa MF-IS2]|uniref:Cysteine proteinase n=1 Tax=Macrolepiota fuliginosa MF-IS2 TaxID=1400762 RepID=A0A9P5XEJ7_9AGAR|nr:cysteine proteinase [Macrolepiota fuliginosa MF-IS2]